MKTLGCALALTLLLVGCGSSSSNEENENGNPDSSTSSTIKNLSGQVNTPASVETPITITALSFSSDDTQVDSVSLTSISANDLDQAFFETELSLSNDGGYIVVTGEKEGFTSFSRSIQFDSPSDIEVQGRMQEALSSTATVADSGFTLRSGVSRNSYTFALMENRQGQRFIESGSDSIIQARTTADATDLLVIDIPSSSLPDDTTSLTAKLANFDPNDAEDSEFFPGEYADSDGNELVSVAFDFAEIETQSGESLGKATIRALARGTTRSTTTEPTIISRYIPEDSCSALESLGDADPDTSGFQIPVFTYNSSSGVWDRLGEGTVYTEDGSPVAEYTSDLECQSNGYYLEIEISNEDFLSSWWNLDYPLTFEEPVNLCAAVQLENQDGNPVSGNYVWLSDDDGRSFSDTYGYSDSEGKVILNTTLIDGSDDRTATIRYWDYTTYEYAEADITLSTACETYTTVTLVRPDTCEVQGSIVDDYGPVEGTDVYAWGYSNENFYYHNSYAQTNANGNYSMDVFCESSYYLYAFSGYTYSFNIFNVNGEIEDNEISDDGETAELEEISVANLAPVAYAYLDLYALTFTETLVDGEYVNVYDLEESESTSLWLYAYDYESDYPLTLEVNFKQIDGTIVDTYTATIEDSTWNTEVESTITFTATSAGQYYLQGSITDALGKTNTLNNFDIFED